MAISPEFFGFQNVTGHKEETFTQEFLIPLLKRLGFSTVANYHGRREFGRDIIFGDIDRFGHVRYYGLQAKFEPSIGLAAVNALIDDCKQAFTVDFSHPHTGESAKISSFYVVNAGTISPEAEEMFFKSLRPSYGDNVRLIDGRGLIALDRITAISRAANRREVLVGLLCEIDFNERVVARVFPKLKGIAAGDGNNVAYPDHRMRLDAVSSYLVCPIMGAEIPIDALQQFCSMGRRFNSLLDGPQSSPLQTVVSIKVPAHKLLSIEGRLIADLAAIREAALEAMTRIGPLVEV